MRDRLSIRLIFAALMFAALGASTIAQSDQAKRANDRMQNSLSAIMTRASAPAVKGKPQLPLRTTFTDADLNSWFTMDGKDNVPAGLLQPVVTFLAAGKLSFRGVVDLDAVRKSKQRGMLDPMNLLSGLLPITMTGALSGAGGMATFDVQSATLGTWPLPRSVLQELFAYYSKSTEYPDGITLGKPFALPAAVKSIVIARGTATVVQ